MDVTQARMTSQWHCENGCRVNDVLDCCSVVASCLWIWCCWDDNVWRWWLFYRSPWLLMLFVLRFSRYSAVWWQWSVNFGRLHLSESVFNALTWMAFRLPGAVINSRDHFPGDHINAFMHTAHAGTLHVTLDSLLQSRAVDGGVFACATGLISAILYFCRVFSYLCFHHMRYPRVSISYYSQPLSDNSDLGSTAGSSHWQFSAAPDLN